MTLSNSTFAYLNIPLPLNLVGGQWQPALSGKAMDVISPIDGQVFAAISDSGAEDVEAAVLGARAAFDTGDWGRMTALERA